MVLTVLVVVLVAVSLEEPSSALWESTFVVSIVTEGGSRPALVVVASIEGWSMWRRCAATRRLINMAPQSGPDG